MTGLNIKGKMMSTNNKTRKIILQVFLFCGGDRNRTGVQTYSSKAFYMFILFCYVGNQLGTNNRLIP